MSGLRVDVTRAIDKSRFKLGGGGVALHKGERRVSSIKEVKLGVHWEKDGPVLHIDRDVAWYAVEKEADGFAIYLWKFKDTFVPLAYQKFTHPALPGDDVTVYAR